MEVDNGLSARAARDVVAMDLNDKDTVKGGGLEPHSTHWVHRSMGIKSG